MKGSNVMVEAAAIEARAGKYLTFKMVIEEYGFKILKVQEIKESD